MLNFCEAKLAWPFSKGSLDLWPQDMWMKMGSMATHESPLYRHAHFMIITCSLGQVIVKSGHWHTDSCCCLLGCSLPCYDLSICFYAKCSTCEGFWKIFVIVLCGVNWFPIMNINIHLHKANIFANSHVGNSIKHLTNLPLSYILNR